MAGRIRSIKPEILDDEKTAHLSHVAWRLFVSTWILADDHGALRGETLYLSGQAFWGTPVRHDELSDAVEELAALELISIYEVRGQRYIQIVGWDKHQKVDKPGKPRVPRPDDTGAWSIQRRKSDRVYFIQSGGSRAIKIGVSWNPARRLSDLQAGHHEKLFLIAEVPGDVTMERELHKEFASTRMSGEWFSCTDELLSRIDYLVNMERGDEESREAHRVPSTEEPRILAPDLRSGPPITDLDQDREIPPPASKEVRAHRLALDWVPERGEANLKAEQAAKARGVDLREELAKLHDWAKGNGAKRKDWDATWRNWTRNARPSARLGSSSRPTVLELQLERVTMLEERERQEAKP